LKRAFSEIGLRQLDRPWISVRIAGDLAEDEITSPGIRENAGGAKLGMGEVGERKGDENYGSG
jgi:hypothetical protein